MMSLFGVCAAIVVVVWLVGMVAQLLSDESD